MRSKKFKDHLEQRLDPQEIKKIERQIKLENESLQNLQRSIAIAIANYMQKTGMGFNDVSRGLGISASQMSKIKNGEANLTIASVAHIAAFLGKKPHLVFN